MKKTTLIIKHYDVKAKIEIAEDADIHQISDAFKSLLYACGYSQNVIEKIWNS